MTPSRKLKKTFTHHKLGSRLRQSQNVHMIIHDRMVEKYEIVYQSWRPKVINNKILYLQQHQIVILMLKNSILI